MTRRIYVMLFSFIVGIVTLWATGARSGGSVLAAPSGSPHAYFDALVARSDHWKSFSLRSPKQLDHPKNGGYAHANSGRLWVTYDPAHDTDPAAQDAAKVTIPAFIDLGARLAAAVDPASTTLRLNGLTGTYQPPRSVKIDDEIMTVTAYDRLAGTLTVSRGLFGTSSASHTANAIIMANTNSLANQVRLPVDTEDGHVYLFTWDAYWTSSYVGSNLKNHKTFQLTNARRSVWIEPQTRYHGDYSSGFDKDADVASLTMRLYGEASGPGITNRDPILPRGGQFILKPNRWTRFWVRLDMRASDYAYLDYWIADEAQNPFQMHRQVPIPPQLTVDRRSVSQFWVEFNTSTTTYAHPRDLVAYVRNVAILRDVPERDMPTLLQRPTGSGTLPFPSAPKNLRIVP